MESLIKQVRVRFSGQESKEEPGSTKERISSHNTSSFKTEKKRPQNWIQRQFSGQMSQDYDSNVVEQATAIAAAAYVITSVEEPNIPEHKKTSGRSEPSLTRLKSIMEDKTGSAPGLASKEFSDATAVTSPESINLKVPKTARIEEEAPVQGKTVQRERTLSFSDKPAPSMKKLPTFAEKSLNKSSEVKTEIKEPKTAQSTVTPEIRGAKPNLVTTTKPSISPAKTERHSAAPGIGQPKADSWERDELAKVQKRYEELNARILSWENKKKQKARNRLDKTESELAQIRLKATERFHNEIADINQIAGGARAKAAERQRNEELKAKQKANIVRKTGDVPRTCFCL